MGFDIQRFVNPIDEELICSICAGVLQDPLQARSCEHAFCRTCIEQWLDQSQTCPIDRSPLDIEQLKPIPRILKNLLNRLDIRCENEGCTMMIKLEHLDNHFLDCQYSPEKIISCEHGCGISLIKDKLSNHNCIQVLRSELNHMKNELDKSKTDLDTYKNQIRTLQEFLRIIRLQNPTISTFFQHAEDNDILRWSAPLPLARVTHWGGMISTPDLPLQESIKRALIDMSCPRNLSDELIENAHERHWPQGLSTLETRQVNRQYYESYVCRRIVGKQAVIIFSCDNQHMDASMIVEGGLVIIFSHGVK